jgi:NAD-dependent DNA ligase
MKKTKVDEIKRLAADIRLHRYLYYEKEPRISDAAFDALFERLKQLDPANQVLLETGAK